LNSYYKKRVEIRTRLKKYDKAVDTFDKASPEYIKLKKEIAYLDIKQYTIKILINSIFGYFGAKRAPLGDIDIARSITLTGQAMVKEAARLAEVFIKNTSGKESIEDPVVAGDTDSIFLSLREVVEVNSLKMLNSKGKITEEYYKVVKNKNDAMFVVLMEEKRLSDKITEFFNSAVLEYKFSDVLYKDFDINERAYAYLTQKYETIAFNKRLKYSYQNERRLFIPGVNDEHPNNFPLQIGDLSGYVVCYMKLYFDDIKHFS